MIDESSRSDDSNLDKPVAQNVTNEDSDSQTSSNKRLVFSHISTLKTNFNYFSSKFFQFIDH